MDNFEVINKLAIKYKTLILLQMKIIYSTQFRIQKF